ncbi:hypothetical protein BDV11DRAFT_166392 [Aspergillus similis]
MKSLKLRCPTVLLSREGYRNVLVSFSASMLSLVSVICSNSGLITLVFLLLLTLCLFRSSSYPQKTLAWVNERQASELWYFAARKRFASDAKGLIASGLRKCPAFNIVTDSGFQTILGPKYANEIRSHPDLDLNRALEADYNAYIGGFEPFKVENEVLTHDTVRTKLTQHLESTTRPLSDETALALRSNWTDSPDWHAVHARRTMLRIVAQISSRIFLGDRACRDPEWLRISIDYATDAFIAHHYLNIWPCFFRPLASRIMTPCRKVRAEYREAKRIITSLVEERRAGKEAAYRAGKTPKQYLDALEWVEQCANGRSYDPAAAQLGFALCHILLKYDIRLKEGYTPRNMVYSTILSADPYAEIEVRRRKEEIAL